MRYRDCIIAWDLEKRLVKVGPHPDRTGWCERPVRYRMTTGGCMMVSKKWSTVRCVMQVMIDYNTLVARDKMDPAAVHQAFLAIDEYRFHVSPDCPGAEEAPEKYDNTIEKEHAWRREEDAKGFGF